MHDASLWIKLIHHYIFFYPCARQCGGEPSLNSTHLPAATFRDILRRPQVPLMHQLRKTFEEIVVRQFISIDWVKYSTRDFFPNSVRILSSLQTQRERDQHKRSQVSGWIHSPHDEELSELRNTC